MGTPMYMAPELAGGADRAGPAADVFSFGVLAFELLADRHPYDAPPIRAILDGRTPEPAALRELRPELPAAVCELVASCLAISPDARPTAPALVAALARA